MSEYKPVRAVDRVKWSPVDLVLTALDKGNGIHLMQPRYFTGLGAIHPESPMGLDYKRNLDNTMFEVNTFLAEMISQSKG